MMFEEDNVNELNNPQLRAPGAMEEFVMNDTVDFFEEHLDDSNEEYDEVESQIMEEISEVDKVNDEIIEETVSEPAATPNPVSYPKTQFISKEKFNTFVNSLSILKNIKQNVIFENGITCFVSDSNAFICKFNIHCPEISFKIPFVEQQASQLAFLNKSDSVSILETEDDYTFSNGTFKFQLRKSIEDTNTWNVSTFTKYYNEVTSCPLVAQYEFTDKDHLSNFLSIIKGVKRSNIEFISEGNEIVFNRGDANSGKFEMLRIPYNITTVDQKEINSMIDSVCMMYDYSTLKISIYYNAAKDSLFVILNGNIDGYEITFMSIAYRSIIDRMV